MKMKDSSPTSNQESSHGRPLLESRWKPRAMTDRGEKGVKVKLMPVLLAAAIVLFAMLAFGRT